MLKVIAHLPSCEDGNCSTVFEDDETGDAVIRGKHPRPRWWRRAERDVRIPAAEWAILRTQL